MPLGNGNKPETYFHGSYEEWLSILPESDVDKIIELLDVKVNKQMLWADLVRIIRSRGTPSASKLGVNPKSLKVKSESFERTLSKTLNLLDKLKYESIFKNGTITTEAEIARRIRIKSKKKKSDKNRKVADLYIKQQYEKNGEYGKYCIFDHELPEAIRAIENIHEYISDVKNDISKEIKGTGGDNAANVNQDELLFEVCKAYKKHTGGAPSFSSSGSSSNNPNQVYGNIIKTIQIILKNTSFARSMSDGGLEKRLRELRKKTKYQALWEGSNSDSKK